eukprot:scaffold119461_cov82-Phaeocystis_antarctica.AAC.7
MTRAPLARVSCVISRLTKAGRATDDRKSCPETNKTVVVPGCVSSLDQATRRRGASYPASYSLERALSAQTPLDPYCRFSESTSYKVWQPRHFGRGSGCEQPGECGSDRHDGGWPRRESWRASNPSGRATCNGRHVHLASGPRHVHVARGPLATRAGGRGEPHICAVCVLSLSLKSRTLLHSQLIVALATAGPTGAW